MISKAVVIHRLLLEIQAGKAGEKCYEKWWNELAENGHAVFRFGSVCVHSVRKAGRNWSRHWHIPVCDAGGDKSGDETFIGFRITQLATQDSAFVGRGNGEDCEEDEGPGHVVCQPLSHVVVILDPAVSWHVVPLIFEMLRCVRMCDVGVGVGLRVEIVVDANAYGEHRTHESPGKEVTNPAISPFENQESHDQCCIC